MIAVFDKEKVLQSQEQMGNFLVGRYPLDHGTWAEIEMAHDLIRADLKELGYTNFTVQMSEFYEETFETPEDYPGEETNWAWKRDLDTHGKIMFSVNLGKEGWTQYLISAMKGDNDDQREVVVIRYGERTLAHVKQVAEAASKR